MFVTRRAAIVPRFMLDACLPSAGGDAEEGFGEDKGAEEEEEPSDEAEAPPSLKWRLIFFDNDGDADDADDDAEEDALWCRSTHVSHALAGLSSSICGSSSFWREHVEQTTDPHDRPVHP